MLAEKGSVYMNFLFPGSFDPITYGHIELIKNASQMVPFGDTLFIGIFDNGEKQNYFSSSERIKQIENVIEQEKIPNAKVFYAYKRFVRDVCEELDATIIVRGLRDHIDFEYERKIQTMNLPYKTIYMSLASAEHPNNNIVSSSLIKNFVGFNGWEYHLQEQDMTTPYVINDIKKKYVRDKIINEFQKCSPAKLDNSFFSVFDARFGNGDNGMWFYHNIDHLIQMYDFFCTCVDQTKIDNSMKAFVLGYILFHDLVYNFGGSHNENEQLSANLCDVHLIRHAFEISVGQQTPGSFIDVLKSIIAFKDTESNIAKLCMLIDYSMFTLSNDPYMKCANNIAREYIGSVVTIDYYHQERLKFLETLDTDDLTAAINQFVIPSYAGFKIKMVHNNIVSEKRRLMDFLFDTEDKNV